MTEQDPAPAEEKLEPLPDQPWERVFDMVLIFGNALLIWVSCYVEGLLPPPPAALFPAADWSLATFNERFIIHVITGSAVIEYLFIFARINTFVPGDKENPGPALRTRTILKGAMALYPWFCLIMLNLVCGGFSG